MNQEDYLHPFTHCTLCEHRCGVNRLEGQTGICRMTLPAVASATLHPAPPESYTIFMAGCNYKCLNCRNWTIAQLPDNGYQPWGYDIKAFNDEVHLALTGASSEPVLRNAKYIGRFAKDKLWEYRILVIPKINEEEIQPLCRFISDIDANLPVCFLAFRPNYVLEHHPGAAAELLGRCVNIAKMSGLKNAYWSGPTGIPGVISALQKKVVSAYQTAGGRLAGAYAYVAGCRTHVRNCAACSSHQACLVKRYVPQIQTLNL